MMDGELTADQIRMFISNFAQQNNRKEWLKMKQNCLNTQNYFKLRNHLILIGYSSLFKTLYSLIIILIKTQINKIVKIAHIKL